MYVCKREAFECAVAHNPKVGRVFDALVDGDSLMAGQVKQVSG